MAVVLVATVWFGRELVSEAFTGLDERLIEWRAVHLARVNPVKVNRVRVRTFVLKDDSQAVALGAADARARYAPVVRPRGEHDAGRDLDFLVHSDKLDCQV